MATDEFLFGPLWACADDRIPFGNLLPSLQASLRFPRCRHRACLRALWHEYNLTPHTLCAAVSWTTNYGKVELVSKKKTLGISLSHHFQRYLSNCLKDDVISMARINSEA
ncbi:hypothetical protein OPV22_028486 [Ensete ventricosum]|uniref:Uncharacterized protein n=1 Tax=Ensete ventricosum TaxID=4639 RepID=A0AAV8Q3T1_ENSVE|nr:hypothetical protein OPV22_028486 [Ensete ventricosum]